jgi:hypothetical protein
VPTDPALEEQLAWLLKPVQKLVVMGDKPYFAYSNHSVFDHMGNLITNFGIIGLRDHMKPGYSIIKAKNTTYHLWADGRVTTPQGRLVVEGGLPAL